MVQPIEYLDHNKTSVRIFRENFWMKELRTIYPYGLNERTDTGDAKNINIIYNKFNKIDRNRRIFDNNNNSKNIIVQ